jgi:hypothetical protein
VHWAWLDIAMTSWRFSTEIGEVVGVRLPIAE